MIRLDAAFTSTFEKTYGGKTVLSVPTDVVFVSEVRLDFTTGAMYATIKRGTDSSGEFVSNVPDLDIVVNPDGSFISTDGTWSGAVPAAPALVGQLRNTFDQFVLASGAVTGKQV